MASPRILIVRTSALGDVVHCLPVLTALRRALPEARIGWVIEEAMAPLLAAHPDLDELLVVRLRTWRKRPFSPTHLGEIARFLGKLQSFSADIALDLMGNHKAGLIAALSFAERRIGLERRSRREPSSALWMSETVAEGGAHAVDRALSVVAALGVEPAEPDFGAAALAGAARAPNVHSNAHSTAHSDADTGGPVLIHPGAGWGNKRYPPRRWGEVAAELGRQLGVRSGVLAGPGEEALAREVIVAADGWAEPTRADTLPELVPLLAGTRLLLAGDTGPLHLAHALGARVLCLMGPTAPEQSGPYRAPASALWRQLPCSFCGRRFAETKACLLDLPPRAVAERAVRLLGSAAAGSDGSATVVATR